MKRPEEWLAEWDGDHVYYKKTGLLELFAAAQKDALESAAKVAEDRADHWDASAEAVGMPTPMACGPLREIAAAIRALLREGK
jgi:hypothetical protein